jgi:hypothetical protein
MTKAERQKLLDAVEDAARALDRIVELATSKTAKEPGKTKKKRATK